MAGIFTAIIVIASLWFLIARDAIPYYPLEFDQHQNVLREPAIFHLTDGVDVEATFRNTDKQAVTFGGVIKWQLVSPPNEHFPVGSELIQFGFTDTIVPGCKEFWFENHPPESVARITREMFDRGIKEVTWKLVGENVIIEPKAGGSQKFDTESFTYVPDSIKLPDYEITHDNTNCSNL